MDILEFKTTKKDEVIDLTDIVNEVIEKSGKDSGVCVLNLLHTTCGLTTADLDPGTDEDLLEELRKMLPKISYRHPHDPSHTPDHILSSIIGTSMSLVFENKRLVLGTWQRVILVELNGPKTRRIAYSIQ
jgi:secondary thiamine-phosphate synthase enzyme